MEGLESSREYSRLCPRVPVPLEEQELDPFSVPLSLGVAFLTKGERFCSPIKHGWIVFLNGRDSLALKKRVMIGTKGMGRLSRRRDAQTRL